MEQSKCLLGKAGLLLSWQMSCPTCCISSVPLCIYLHLHLSHHFSLSHLGSGCFGRVTPSQIKGLHVQTFLVREARSFAAGKRTCGHEFGRRTQDLGYPSCPLQSVQGHLFMSFGRCSGFSFHPGECNRLLAQPAFCPHKYSDINIWRSFLL